MVFSSLNFLFLFLPIVLLAHTWAGDRLRNWVLLIASLFFYAWGEPIYVGLMALSIGFNYAAGRHMAGIERPALRKTALFVDVAVNLLLLGFYKYYGFAASAVGTLLGVSWPVYELALPIGISFYTFQALSYEVDVYRGDVPPQKSLLEFGVYITMFPQLVAGPIVKYGDIRKSLSHRRVGLSDMGAGVERLIRGLFKKVLLANNLGMLCSAIAANAGRSVLSAWLGAIAYALQIYFDFSGYSDMAIGMGRMLGFRFLENFNDPYMADSVTDFWRRWHISLSSWFRDYVYIPLGGSRVGKFRLVLNLLIVWMLTGLWHGASWNFVAWGAYYGALLILEKLVLAKPLAKLPKAIRRILTLALVTVGWVIFSNTDLPSMTGYLRSLFGMGAGGFLDRSFLYDLRSNLVLLLLGILCATPLVRNWLSRQSGRRPVLNALLLFGMLLLSTAYLVSSTYNPFLYFRF